MTASDLFSYAFMALFSYKALMTGIGYAMAYLTLLLPEGLKGFCCRNFVGVCVAIVMVLIVVMSVITAIEDQEHYTTHIRIAFLIFAMLQLLIAALRFTPARDIEPRFPLAETLAQFPAVYLAYGMGGLLEALFFA